MDRELVRLIRKEVHRDEGPSFAAIWIFLGSVISLGGAGVLGWIDHFLRSHHWIH